MSSKSISGHIDFALDSDEIMLCVRCGEVPNETCLGRWYDSAMLVTPAGRYPVGGLVGVCSSCGWSGRVRKREILATWRKTAPPFIQVVPGVPVQLVARGCCDDSALAQLIRDTFEKVPPPSRQKIIDYVMSDEGYATGKGMRFEALGRWPGMRACQGMNLDRGHAIRLRASYVKRASIESLVSTVAHELAHSEQWADGLFFEYEDECERDVEARLRAWGFDDGATETDRHDLLFEIDQVIKYAKRMKKKVACMGLPSGNFAAEAVAEATRASNMLIRSCCRWSGV